MSCQDDGSLCDACYYEVAYPEEEERTGEETLYLFYGLAEKHPRYRYYLTEEEEAQFEFPEEIRAKKAIEIFHEILRLGSEGRCTKAALEAYKELTGSSANE